MSRRREAPKKPLDLTVAAIPFYFASMGAEYLWLRRRARRVGPAPGNYERRDTIASLTMGVGSLLAPTVTAKLLKPLTPGRGRYGKTLVKAAIAAAAVTTAADLVSRRLEPDQDRVIESPAAGPNGSNASSTASGPRASRDVRRAAARLARRVAALGGVGAVVAGGTAITTSWASITTPERLWRRRLVADLGSGPLALAAAIAAWDFVYYWDHRFMHTSRYMWAIHVVHHSSEHYNLSTALRQPVADAFGTFVPFGGLCLFGIRPSMVETARGVNLLYQYWIHTESIRRLGPTEVLLNTPSHHRVHHGSNRQYLDRNHGSILILWDKLFGTFEPEDERVVYGLTKNIGTFNPLRIATHEYVEMLRDVASATSWSERLSYVVRGPGWAKAHRSHLERTAAGTEEHQTRPARRRELEVAVGA